MGNIPGKCGERLHENVVEPYTEISDMFRIIMVKPYTRDV
jgi:hypothetical protein